MNKFLKYWWVYSVSCIALCALEVYIVTHDIRVMQLRYVIIYILLGLLVIEAVAWITALFKKKFAIAFVGIPAGLIVSAVICLPPFFLYAIATGGEGDAFGMEHPIPEWLSYNEPDESFCIEDVDSLDDSSWLRIHKSTQGGIYNYAYFSPSLPDGHIYLKCFEVTENILLSEERVTMSSHNEVKGHLLFGLAGKTGCFTIYEGSFGDYYAVRVEVWFHDEKTGEERMLNSKVYKMEGWQR
jgi:hypothetical protein